MRKTETFCCDPLYVVIAGQGGSGKEGAAELVATQLTSLTGRQSILTREPSNAFRGTVFKANGEGASGLELAEMFYADGSVIENGTVKPALSSGQHVVSVRGRESTFAYEIPKGATEEQVLKIHQKYLGDFGPNLVFYLCLSDPSIGINRKPSLDGDTFDTERVAFRWEVKRVYDSLAQRFSVAAAGEKPPIFGHWITIDADPPKAEVYRQITSSLCEYLKLRAKIS